MLKKDCQANITILICLALSAFLAALVIFKIPLNFLVIALVALGIFILAFLKTDIALSILIFSMLLSPELKIAQVPDRAVVVRIDDILVFVVFFAWLFKMAVNKDLGVLRFTPLNRWIIGYIVVCIVATNIGILTGKITPIRSFFYILKYVEYFLLYFLFTNNLSSKKQIKTFLACFLVTGLIICIYALTQVGTLPRTTAPFEGQQAEPNTLGGYLILLFAVCMGVFLYNPSRNWRLFSGGILCFIILPFAFTLSRSSYFAFIPMYMVFIILSRRKRVFLISAFALAIVISPILMPHTTEVITGRIKQTFVRGAEYKPFGKRITLEESAAARIHSWKRVLGQWTKSPFLGYGVTGVGLVDVQYARVLGETGIIGFFVFIGLLVEIFRNSLYAFNNMKDDWPRCLALGFLAGFVGLLTQALGANTFIIVRIMEPFWFLTAIVIMLPEIYQTNINLPRKEFQVNRFTNGPKQ